MFSIRPTLVLAVTLVLLAGCGKRGPLYLPGEKDTGEPASPQETPTQSEPKSSGQSGY